MLSNVTALITTYLRDEYLFNAVRTLHHTYPEMRIIVGDQEPSYTKMAKLMGMGVGSYVTLPRDCGVSFARNRMLEYVTTKYFLLCEDDFSFSPASNVPQLLALMGLADIAGGALLQKGYTRHYEANFREVPDNGAAKWAAISHIYQQHEGIRYQSAECVFNFYMARAAAVREMGGWDEQFKIGYEHSDFFIRARRAGVKVVYCPDAVAVHRDESIQADPVEYTCLRSRSDSQALFFKKWGYTYLEDIRGGRLYSNGTKVSPGRPAPPLYQLATFENPFKHAAAKRGLALAKQALDSIGVPFWLSNGTLLGAVRDGDFIPHDTDLDLGVWDGADAGKIRAALRERGFVYAREFGTLGNGYEMAFLVPGPHKVKLDIFFYQREMDHCWMGLHTKDGMKRMRFPTIPMLAEFNGLGAWYPVPYNAPAYLEANYGPGWRAIIDRNWKWDTSPRNLEG